MDSGWWEPGFSVLKWEVTDKREGENDPRGTGLEPEALGWICA